MTRKLDNPRDLARLSQMDEHIRALLHILEETDPLEREAVLDEIEKNL